MAEFKSKYGEYAKVSVKNIFGYVSGQTNGPHAKFYETWCVFEPNKTMSSNTLKIKNYRKKYDEDEPVKDPEMRSTSKLEVCRMKAVKCLTAVIGLPCDGEVYSVNAGKMCKLISDIEF